MQIGHKQGEGRTSRGLSLCSESSPTQHLSPRNPKFAVQMGRVTGQADSSITKPTCPPPRQVRSVLTDSSPSPGCGSHRAVSCQRHGKLQRAHAAPHLLTRSAVCPCVAVDRRPLSWWGCPRGSGRLTAVGCTQAASESFNTPFLMARD